MYSYITIKRNGKKQLTDNFNESEIFCKQSDFKEDHHEFDMRTISAAQILRDYFKSPLTVSSSLRVGDPKAHGYNCALDLHLKNDQKVEQLDKFYNEIKDGKEIFKTLTSIGVTGLGVYDWGIHVDTWEDFPTGHRKKRHGQIFGLWDERGATIDDEIEEKLISKIAVMPPVQKIGISAFFLAILYFFFFRK